MKILLAVVLVLLTPWAAGLLIFAGPWSGTAANASAIALVVLAVAAVAGLFVRRLRAATVLMALCLFAVALWWSSIEPSNDREWETEVSRLTWVDVDGDLFTFHNVRNFDYRTETDFTPAWYDKTYKLSELQHGDVVASYWMGDDIAHIFVSFGFANGEQLAISIETRRELGESYSTFAGFFRRYELFYVVADERDLIGVRTNYRKDPPEDVYVYRTRAELENLRHLFQDYVRSINELRQQPEFYNTLTTNCTTGIWMHTHVNPGRPPLSWKVLASGHVPEYLYELGRIDTSLPFEEVRRRAHVNEAAQAADKAPDFSQRIRAGIPIPASGP